MSDASDFYDVSLPAAGHYYIGRKQGKQLVADRASFDKRLGPQPDLYTAFAQFSDPQGGRKAENIVSLRSFRLDIDTKLTHDKSTYADHAEALGALVPFVKASGLPTPWIADSGGGLHVYWPMDADIPHDEWRQTAELLKQACILAKLGCDHAITADGTRLMRAIGSTHGTLKTPVALLKRGPVSKHKLFRAILEGFTGISATTMQVSRTPKQRVGNMLTDVKWPDSYADAAANECLLLDQFRNGVDHDYNLWTAALSNMARMVDGEQKAHEWSKAQRPGEYSEMYTDAKLAEFSGPMRCRTISALAGSPCHACPNFNTVSDLSPVRLGECGVTTPAQVPQVAPSPPPSVPPPPTPPTPPQASPQPPAQPTPPIPSTLPPPPAMFLPQMPANGRVRIFKGEPFYWRYRETIPGQPCRFDGVVVEVRVKKDISYPLLTKAAFYVTGMVHSANHTMQCGCRYFISGQQKEVNFPLTQAMVHGPSWRSELGNNGVTVDNPKYAGRMQELISKWYTAAQANTSLVGGDTFGLQDGGDLFLIGEQAVHADGSITSALLTGSAHEVKTKFNAITDTNKPSLVLKAREWGSLVDRLYNHDELTAHQFVILCGFASMVWSFIPGSIEGIVISATGTGSGTAKTSCARVAGSVWGNGSYIERAKGSTVAHAIQAATFKHLPLIVDEVTHLAPDHVVNLISDLGNGTDRMRGTTMGTTRKTKRWKMIALLTSNDRLASRAANKQAAAGFDARLWELPFDECTPQKLRERLHRQWDAGNKALDPTQFENGKPDTVISDICDRLGGYAGLLFATQIMPIRGNLRQMVTTFVDEFVKAGVNNTENNRAAVQAAACAMVSLALLQHMRVLSFDAMKMQAWLVERLKDRTGVTAAIIYDPYPEFIRSLLQHHGDLQRFRTEGNLLPLHETSLNPPRSVHGVLHATYANGQMTDNILYLNKGFLNVWFPETSQTILDVLRHRGDLLDDNCLLPADLAVAMPTQSVCYKIRLAVTGQSAGAGSPAAPLAGTANVYPLRK